MPIQPGQKIPAATLSQMTEKGPRPVKSEEFFAGKKIVLFAVPGAFTPTCSNQHLPGFIRYAPQLREKGVDAVVCLSVNDAFVMDAWGRQKNVGDKVLMLADGNGEFTRALGVDFDGSSFGMGQRSLRYSMLVENGVVKIFNQEPNPAEARISGAEHLISQL